MSTPVTSRYDFVFLFDVADGNPNGDPDAGNMPRADAETGHGLITDVCLKRKVRNYVGLKYGNQPPNEIYVKEKAVLNEQHGRAYVESEETRKAVEAWEQYNKDKKNNPKPNRSYEDVAGDWVCENFFDVRTFGAVMSTSDTDKESKLKKTAGQVRGPVQITFARSISPVVPLEHSISVCAARKGDKPIEEQVGIQGRKFTIPYGLYLARGFVSAPLAEQTGFSEGDLELLWEALANMFDHDRSAARGQMASRGLIRFKHESRMGNAPADGLFRRVKVERRDGIEVPRSFDDYVVTVDRDGLPAGVEIIPADGIL